MTRITILIALIGFLVFGGNEMVFATSLLVLESPTISSDGDGYGGHNWNNMSWSIISATGNNVDVVSTLDDLALILSYDALWIDRRSAGYPNSDLLSASELSNLSAFINTGKRVVIIGEWWMNEWDNQFLNILGGSFGGTICEGVVLATTANSLVDGVTQVYVAAAGVATGGTSLFACNFATLWRDNNVLTVLDVGLFGDLSWSTADNARFATNIANWIASPVPEPSTMFLLGSGLLALVGYGRKKFFKK